MFLRLVRMPTRARWSQAALTALTLTAALPARADGLRLEFQDGAQELEAGVPVRLWLREAEDRPPSCWRRVLERWWRSWTWTVLEDDRPLPEAAGGLIRILGAGAFTFTPPMTDRTRTLVLQVAARQDPRLQAQATVRVVPPAPLDLPQLTPDPIALIGAYLPEAARASRESVLPFLDPVTGGRDPALGQVADAAGGFITQPWRHRVDPVQVCAGYGIPVRLAWPAEPGAAGQCLSYRTWAQGPGADSVRLDVTGLEELVLPFTEAVSDCAVESLSLQPHGRNTWRSRRHRGSIRVRGLLPLAGNDVSDEASAVLDGQGVSARFRGPAGLALMAPQSGAASGPSLLAAEPEAHVLRLVSAQGQVRTLAGVPGVPGCRDGAGDQALFDTPSHVAARAGLSNGAVREWLVADSGNHLIRRVDEHGCVTTPAGRPKQAGHRDHQDRRQAMFSNPQGIAVDADGNVYVADQGNAVIRRIGPDGVTTLAGRPGVRGCDDGLGDAARFFDLKALAWDRRAPGLYLLDGHALRWVSLDGQVLTLLGQVDVPGFMDDRLGAAGWPLSPCFREPRALAAGFGFVVIADTGNHALRECRLPALTLRTLAGDPQRPHLGWGLLRDGLEDFPEEGYATLAAPRGLAWEDRPGAETLYVASGPALAQIQAVGRSGPPRPRLHPGTIQPLAPDAPCPVEFMVTRGTAAPEPGAMADYHFTVEWQGPDGRPVGDGKPLRGTGAFSVLQRLRGPAFNQEGHGRIRVRCVTLDGVSVGISKAVPVRSEPAREP